MRSASLVCCLGIGALLLLLHLLLHVGVAPLGKRRLTGWAPTVHR
jgi:hypothetical protein